MNVKKTKDLIKQALENLPLDIRFEDVKLNLNNSLNKINEIEKKESNKFNITKTWEQSSKSIYNNMNKLNFKQKSNILNVIEQLIDKEKKNIQEIGKNKNQKNILFD